MSTLSDVQHYLHLKPDSKGRIYPKCPYCGKESSNHDVHTILDDKGYKCFVCGKRVSAQTFAKDVGLIGDEALPELPERPDPPKPEPAKWLSQGEYWLQQWDTIGKYLQWNAYKRLKDETIDAYRLGYGKLPQYSSRCQHDRLIVPLIVNGKLVGARARWNGCTCDSHKTKWLSPKDSQMVLYNGAMLGDGELMGLSAQVWQAGAVLWIVENPIDALKMTENGMYAVATLGVTVWRPDWTRVIKDAQPALVIVCYDHDLAGNGANSAAEYAEMVRLWREKNAGGNVPIPNGVRLANELNGAGVLTRLYKWPKGTPLKADIGDLLENA